MREIIIKENDSNQRLDKFLSKKFKTMPKSLMYKYIRKKYIKLNGKKASQDAMLKSGDVITLYINDEFFNEEKNYEFMKASSKLDIIYEDDNILLLNKKPGVIVHQDKNYDSDTLNLRVKRYLYEKGEYDPLDENSFSPALANRIDRNTSGIVIAAKNAASLRILNEKIRNREIRKFYICITIKRPKKDKDTLRAFTIKDEDKNTVKVFDKEVKGSKEIITSYRVLDSQNGFSLCEVEIKTGRTHQIRAHLSHIGCPILGDNKYGDRALNKKYNIKGQVLCSYKIIFDFKEDAGVLDYLKGKTFTADVDCIPKSFEKFKSSISKMHS